MREVLICKRKSFSFNYLNATHSHYQNDAHPPHLVLQCQGFRLSFLLWVIIRFLTMNATP
ncbi:hypothetical protein ISREJYDI_CDS0022 [Pseudomonas phage UNO-G1W1]|uniref:Uncharacterized protein n=1 Tax=Pseudomonas phage UNO-G1W1 TaxID=3136609 RepID=A0AAX4QMH3_9CAUD